MPDPLAYLNGRFLPQAQAALPLHDAGFVFGATVADFCRTYRRQLFRWPDHLARFRRDCADCFIPLPPSDDEITGVAVELVRHNGRLLGPGQELALITFATPGPVGYYLGQPGGAGDGPPTLGLHTFPLPTARYRRFFTEGVTLAIPGHFAADDYSILPPRVKHRSRLHWWVAGRMVHDTGAVALLTTNAGKLITETAVGNVLAVIDGVVVSPMAYHILDGISLRVVEELCRGLGIPFRFDHLRTFQVDRWQEAMLTGTAFCLAGVSRLDDDAVPWPGPMFQRLLAAWSDLVGVDIAGQFLK